MADWIGSDEMTMLRLVESHCVPLITYAIEIIFVADQSERRKLRVAYNSVFRKIFGYSLRESVTALQGFLSRPTWEELVDKRSSSFLLRARSCPLDSLVSRYSFISVYLFWTELYTFCVNKQREKKYLYISPPVLSLFPGPE